MRTIHYMLVLSVALIVIACTQAEKPEKYVPNTYSGEKQPCIDYYDELWCKKTDDNTTITDKKNK